MRTYEFMRLRMHRSKFRCGSSGALALVTNLVIAWNTQALQAALDRRRAELGERSTDQLRRIPPAGFEHINFNGVPIFPRDNFRNRLLPSNTPSARPAFAPG
jgi:hypothetical protein